jgi:O-acetylserine/cysteine efflux transporter
VHKHWSRKGLLLGFLAAALWGLTPVATKIALRGFSPELLGFLRLAIAAVLFRIFSGNSARWFVADVWIWLAGAGLGADFLLYNYGLQRTTANVAGLVINVEMISTIAFAVWILGERLGARRVLGSAMTLGGVLLVTVDGMSLSDLVNGRRAIGNILVMSAGIAWSLYAVAQRRTVVGHNLYQRLTPIFSVAALVSAPAMFHEGAWTATGGAGPVLMFIVLTLFGTSIVYWIYARAQQLIDVSILAIVLCTIPIFTVLFAWLLLGEGLTTVLLVGGGIVTAGIAVIATERPTRKTTPPVP